MRRGNVLVSKGRGFVFSMDALIAGVVAASLLLALANTFNRPESQISPVSTLQQNAQDGLTAMDRQGILQNAFSASVAAENASVNSFLSSALPSQLGANMTVETYEYQAGNCPNGCRVDGNSPINSFCTCERFVTATANACVNTTASCQWLGRAQRMFYSFVNGNDMFGKATLEVWPK